MTHSAPAGPGDYPPLAPPSTQPVKVKRRKWPWITGAVILLVIVAAAIGGSGSKKKTPVQVAAAVTTSAAAKSAGPKSAAPTTTPSKKPSPTASKPGVSNDAVKFIKKETDDATTVQVDVVSVQAAVSIASTDPAAQQESDLNQIAQLAQQGHDDISNIKTDMAVAGNTTSGAVGNDEVEAFSACNDLKNALGALVTYTGDPNPATLAKFTTQFQPAVAEWNQAVAGLWAAAGMKSPPTI